jgi:hypothetical protein
LKSHSISYIRFALLAAVMAVLAACAAKSDNENGMILLPGGMEGSDPVKAEIHRALDIQTVSGGTVAKGAQTTILAGRRHDYELRTLLSFRTALASDVQIQSVRIQLYVIRARGTLPLTLSIHRLEKDFEETEVTFEQAAEGDPWTSPGGDYEISPLGTTPFTGDAYDTVSVGLNIERMKAWLPGKETLSLEVIASGGDDAMVEFLAREGYPTSPTASRLEIYYTESGSSEQQLLDRRAFMDATIVRFDGTNNSDNLMISASPARQLFFRYDFSNIPENATINRASIHLSMAGAAFVDSFLVSTYLSESLEFVTSEATALDYGMVLGESDTTLVMDVTKAVQKAVLEGGGSSSYVVLANLVDITTAGYAEFYSPAAADSSKQPYITVIYSGLPVYAGSTSQSQY